LLITASGKMERRVKKAETSPTKETKRSRKFWKEK
jgi:hypothetical protein